MSDGPTNGRGQPPGAPRPRRSLPLQAALLGALTLACAALAAVAGCASVSTTPLPPVFYPPLPERPKIQFLRAFSSAADVAPKPGLLARLVFGTPGQDEAAALVQPYGIAWDDGRLYVCDSGRGRAVVFDLARRAFRTFGDSGPHRLALPINISLGPQGEKYVADTGRGDVLVFDSSDTPIRALGLPGGMRPCDALRNGGELFVADLKSNSILVLDPQSGRLLRRLGTTGSAPGEFFGPTNLAFGPDGSLYVSDTLNARVQKLDGQGRVLQVIGSLGDAIGGMVRPKGIAVDRAGRLYVADAATDSVQIYDPEGRLLLMLGGPGDGPGKLSLPAKVAVSYDGIKYFARYASPEFRVECLIFVTTQLGPAKVNVYGLGTYLGEVPGDA